jgi:hypothetical protein
VDIEALREKIINQECEKHINPLISIFAGAIELGDGDLISLPNHVGFSFAMVIKREL